MRHLTDHDACVIRSHWFIYSHVGYLRAHVLKIVVRCTFICWSESEADHTYVFLHAYSCAFVILGRYLRHDLRC